MPIVSGMGVPTIVSDIGIPDFGFRQTLTWRPRASFCCSNSSFGLRFRLSLLGVRIPGPFGFKFHP